MPGFSGVLSRSSRRVSNRHGFSILSALLIFSLVVVLMLVCAALVTGLRKSVKTYSRKKEVFQTESLGSGLFSSEETCSSYVDLSSLQVTDLSKPLSLNLKLGGKSIGRGSPSGIDPKAKVYIALSDLKNVTASKMASAATNHLYLGQLYLKIGDLRERSLGALFLETNSGGKALSCFQVPSKKRLCAQSGGSYQDYDGNCVLKVKTEVHYNVIYVD